MSAGNPPPDPARAPCRRQTVIRAGRLDAGWAFVAIALWSVGVLAMRLPAGAILASDSQQYLDAAVLRPPGYPLLLEGFRRLFGDGRLVALVVFQVLCVQAAALHLSAILWRRYALRPVFLLGLYVLLTLPLTSASQALGLHGAIGNRILTEAVSYALFLLAVACVVQGIFRRRPLEIVLTLAVIALGTLVRTQMIFMYSMAAALAWHSRHGLSRRTTVLLCLSGVLLVVGADLTERLYHSRVNGYWGRVSLGTGHLLVGALYMAPPEAASLATRESDREVLRRTYAFLRERRLHSADRFAVDRRLVDLYDDNFATMLNAGLMAAFNQVYAQTAWSDPALIAFDRFSDRVAPAFLWHYPAALCKLFLLKLLYSLRFREGVFAAALLLLPALGVRREVAVLAWLVALLLLANRALLVPVLYLGDRYLFYTDVLEYAVLLVVAGHRLAGGGGSLLSRPGSDRPDAAPLRPARQGDL